jgi:hypothetical protein
VGELRGPLEEAKQHLADAAEELAKAQSLEGREKSGERAGDAMSFMTLRPAGA